jgi:hypothetical protein
VSPADVYIYIGAGLYCLVSNGLVVKAITPVQEIVGSIPSSGIAQVRRSSRAV